MNYTPGSFQLKMWDIEQLGILPDDWSQQVSTLAELRAETCILDGKSSTSRETPNAPPIEVCVVAGGTIKSCLPWLYDLYAGALRELAGQLIGRDLAASSDLNSSININLLSGEGSRYERHVDSNPVTGILYANTLCPDEGGALVFDHATGSDRIFPRRGLFIAFDALATPHYVEPLIRSRRLSIPMNYYIAGENQRRPGDLDSYLYDRTR